MKKFLLALGIGFICIFVLNFHFESTEAALASQVIRFHVLANSNTDADQKLKLKVRDRVINEMNNLFDSNGDIALARCTVIENIDKIKAIAKDEILKNGYSYDVKVSLGSSDFPTKNYGEIVLPAGTYEALKIEIGSAEGQNWWCVLFPSLCLSAASEGGSIGTSLATLGLSGDQYRIITDSQNATYYVRFKILEVFEELVE